jgi:hypothetical protein
MIRAKRIIADSIKDHLIPRVSSKNNPKYMFDDITKMYEGQEHQPEDEFENPTQEYKDVERRNNSRLFLWGFSIQGTIRSNWRQLR